MKMIKKFESGESLHIELTAPDILQRDYPIVWVAFASYDNNGEKIDMTKRLSNKEIGFDQLGAIEALDEMPGYHRDPSMLTVPGPGIRHSKYTPSYGEWLAAAYRFFEGDEEKTAEQMLGDASTALKELGFELSKTNKVITISEKIRSIVKQESPEKVNVIMSRIRSEIPELGKRNAHNNPAEYKPRGIEPFV